MGSDSNSLNLILWKEYFDVILPHYCLQVHREAFGQAAGRPEGAAAAHELCARRDDQTGDLPRQQARRERRVDQHGPRDPSFWFTVKSSSLQILKMILWALSHVIF